MNRFDDVRLNVRKLLEEQNARLPQPDPTATSAAGLGALGRLTVLARLYWTGLLIKTGLYKRLVHANLKLDWFYEFQDYWVNELGNRPIQPHDFYFLHGVYRQRIQNYPSEEEQPSGAIPDEVRVDGLLFQRRDRGVWLVISPHRSQGVCSLDHLGAILEEYGCPGCRRPLADGELAVARKAGNCSRCGPGPEVRAEEQ